MSLRLFWKHIWFIVLLLPILVVYFFKLTASYNFDNDFGRDLLDIYAITRGDITLLGPKLSFGGLHAGPYYYYLFAPVVALFPQQPEAVLYAGALLTWLSLVLVAYLCQKLHKIDPLAILAGSYWIGLSTYFMYAARGPGNAFSYIGWQLVLITLFPWFWQKARRWYWYGLYGLGWGIVVNFHLVVVVIASLFLSALAIKALLTKTALLKKLLPSLMMAVGFAASFGPIVLFDLTHQFVIFTNTFVNKSYLAFTENTNLPNPLPTSADPLTNLWLLNQAATAWVVTGILLLLAVIAGLLIIKRKELTSTQLAFSAITLLSWVLLTFIARSQLAFHYLFPFILLTQCTVWYLCSTIWRSWRWYSAVVVIFGSIYLMETWQFAAAVRPTSAFRDTIAQFAETPAAEQLKDQPFQVYTTRETQYAPLGYEYRYFLSTRDLKPLPPAAFAEASRLVWIAEQPVNTGDVRSWELDQFGSRKEIAKETIGDRTIYLFAKQ